MGTSLKERREQAARFSEGKAFQIEGSASAKAQRHSLATHSRSSMEALGAWVEQERETGAGGGEGVANGIRGLDGVGFARSWGGDLASIWGRRRQDTVQFIVFWGHSSCCGRPARRLSQ